MPETLKIHPSDNIIVALRTLREGETVRCNGETFLIREKVEAKHKFAAHNFSPGDEIIMYGVKIGKAVKSIARGSLISTENIAHAAAGFGKRQARETWQPPAVTRWKNATFNGYHRSDGKVGTANYWLVIPLVFCENRNVQFIKQALEKELGYARHTPYESHARRLAELYRAGKSAGEILQVAPEISDELSAGERLFPHVDGVKFLQHEGGCGGTRQDSDTLSALLAGYILNPNVAGATVLSLGCQHSQVEILKEAVYRWSPQFDKPLYVFEQQKSRSEREMLGRAIQHTFAGMMQANELRRSVAALRHLNIGVECGGSDGFSGISANPAIGFCADLLVTLGGTVLLTEFPELCGVEQELIDRAADEETAEKFRNLQSAYAARAEAVGSGFYQNPSPGNIRDGLITDAMKSAGAAKKGGTSPVTGVLDYTEQPQRSGLNLLCTPGNDVESTTGMAASGANLILFSTGLGTPTGNPIAPVIKISSNTTLAQRMPDIIDYDAGAIISGEKSIEQCGEELLELCIQVAGGAATPKAVQLGQDDFIPWKRGVSL
jgi:altronate hydrolase